MCMPTVCTFTTCINALYDNPITFTNKLLSILRHCCHTLLCQIRSAFQVLCYELYPHMKDPGNFTVSIDKTVMNIKLFGLSCIDYVNRKQVRLPPLLVYTMSMFSLKFSNKITTKTEDLTQTNYVHELSKLASQYNQLTGPHNRLILTSKKRL